MLIAREVISWDRDNHRKTYFPGKKQFAYTFEDPLLSSQCASSLVNRILPSLLLIVSTATEATGPFVRLPSSITPHRIHSCRAFDGSWRHDEVKFQFLASHMK